jgi:hypothetical protein
MKDCQAVFFTVGLYSLSTPFAIYRTIKQSKQQRESSPRQSFLIMVKIGPPPKMGLAIQTQQALVVASILFLCYLIANPEFFSDPVQSWLNILKSKVAYCFGVLLNGWWPFVAGMLSDHISCMHEVLPTLHAQ